MAEPAESTEIPAPRANPHLIGQTAGEAALLRAWQSGRMPHAWLLAGPRGVGKETLAYRFARFVLAEGAGANAEQGGLFGSPAGPPPDTLALDAGHPVFRRVAAGGHPDLFTLEPGMIHPETKKTTQEIVVSHVRRVNEQVRMTPVEGGWRVAVINEAEAMNSNAANALLKLLEEPPSKALILLISHAPGRLLPTIRSRCRTLMLPPLEDRDIHALIGRYRAAIQERDRDTLIRLCNGSIGRAVELEERGGAELYDEVLVLLGKLPRIDVPALHEFAERMSRKSAEGGEEAAASFRTTIELLSELTARLVKHSAAGIGNASESEAPLFGRVAGRGPQPWLEAGQRIRDLGSATDGLNLDRKQALIQAFLAVERAAAP